MKFKIPDGLVALVFTGATVLLALAGQSIPDAILVLTGLTVGHFLGQRVARPVQDPPEAMIRPYIPGGTDEP